MAVRNSSRQIAIDQRSRKEKIVEEWADTMCGSNKCPHTMSGTAQDDRQTGKS